MIKGGYWHFIQYDVDDIASDLEQIIAENGTPQNHNYMYSYFNFSEEVIEKFKNAVHAIRKVANIINEIDFLLLDQVNEKHFLEEWEKAHSGGERIKK